MRYVIREKFFHLGEDSQITDETGTPLFEVDGKILSLHNTLVMRDMQGQEVARIQHKLIALRPTYEIQRPGAGNTEIRKRFINLLHDRYVIDVPGPNDMELEGSILEHNFTIRQGGEVVAVVSKQWISLTDTYGVAISPGQDDVLILASILALDLAEDAERRS